MRWARAAMTGISALACAWATACGGSGHDRVTITTQSAFPHGFLPVLLDDSSGRGDVAFRADGDLYAVDGGTHVISVSRADGVTNLNFAQVSNESLASIIVSPGEDRRLFAGDQRGRIWRIPADGGNPTEPPLEVGSNAISGLAFAPSGFGEFGGSLFSTEQGVGIRRDDVDDPFATGNYADLVFSGTTLLAIDVNQRKIVTVSPDGVSTPLPSTPAFTNPVGITVDLGTSEIYVADAGDGVLYTVPAAGGARTARAAYSFDSIATSGLAYDGLGAIAFITKNPPAIRGAAVPRVDPANPNFGLAFPGPTVGYGDLELDRLGGFVLAANDDDDPDSSSDSTNGFLFGASRDLNVVSVLASGLGSPVEEFLGVAVDPVQQAVFFSTRRGNVYRRASDGSGTGAPHLSVTTNVAVMGLERVPEEFGALVGEDLIATTAAGQVILIHSQAQTHRVIASITTTSGQPAPLSDLVIDVAGTLYVLDNGQTQPPGNPRILIVESDGSVTSLASIPSAQLGRPDGIEIDEGGRRLLVASETTSAMGGQLLSVDLRPGRVGEVRALANFEIDKGFFPTGVVYDRLGTAIVRAAIVRQGSNSTSLRAIALPLPAP